MMGSKKLSTIRAELRKSFDMSDADLLAWFDQQIEDMGRTPKGGQKEIETLRLLRDALVVEVKRQVPESVAIPEK
jgi:hypothetical protein